MASRRSTWPQLKHVETPAALRERLAALEVELPVLDDDEVAPVLGAPWRSEAGTAPNRWVVLPMEGWDATGDGRPSDLLRRRWQRFAAGGAGMLWGGEAFAVDPDGRANPNQLTLGPSTAADLGSLATLVADAAEGAGHAPPVLGLQLTHSGRFARPAGVPAPRVAYRHPLLDERVGVDDDAVLGDADLDRLAERFVEVAGLAHEAGFSFVDVKSCHGYLLHELLSARTRPGPYGGDLDGRSHLLRSVIGAVRDEVPGLAIGVRLSAYDLVPWRPGDDGVGVPEAVDGDYPHAFGGDGTGQGIDLSETHRLLDELASLGVTMVCMTAGSPYYNPHIQRPAYFPPSDGYGPPEDPLVGVARMAQATRELELAHPDVSLIASGLSYLQDWLPHVAAGLVRDGWATAAGYGRMALSYPDLPADVLAGRPLQRRLVCRTFSDCTTAPRHGLVSGCYPLDPHYKAMPARVELAAAKREARQRSAP